MMAVSNQLLLCQIHTEVTDVSYMTGRLKCSMYIKTAKLWS